MFQIGFLEIVVVGMVALVVLGPEKLPGAIRTVSLWVGRLRRSFNNIKQDIEREIGADEIRRQLRNEAIMEKFKQTKSQVQNTIESVKKGTEELRKGADLEAQVAAFTSQDNNKPADKPAVGSAAATDAPAPEATTPPAADAVQPEPATSKTDDSTKQAS